MKAPLPARGPAAAPRARTGCQHHPPCPSAGRRDALAAVVVAAHPGQGWYLLCNGVIAFDDTGAIAGSSAIPPRRASGGRAGRGRPAPLPECTSPEEGEISYASTH